MEKTHKILLRRKANRLVMACRRLFWHPALLLMRCAALRVNLITRFDMIPLIETYSKSAKHATVVLGALACLKEASPRHYAHLKRQASWIQLSALEVDGEYDPLCQTIALDLSRWTLRPEDAGEWHYGLIAALLVHEATHGRIAAFGIPYNKRTRLRIERLCCLQARRFAQRLWPDYPGWVETAAPEFDEACWTRSWELTKWQKIRGRLKRILSDQGRTIS